MCTWTLQGPFWDRCGLRMGYWDELPCGRRNSETTLKLKGRKQIDKQAQIHSTRDTGTNNEQWVLLTTQ